MNDKRRSVIRIQIKKLNSAISALEQLAEQESDALQNLPESLENSNLAASIEEAEDHIRDAIANVEIAVDCLESAIT